MSNSVKKLVRLIEENPTLPIVPMVYTDSDDDRTCVIGSIIDCAVKEYTIYEEQMYDDKDNFIEVYLRNNNELAEKFKNTSDKNMFLKELIKNEFTKAIIVTIDVST